MTIAEAVSYYLDTIVAEGASPGTIRAYRPWLLRLERLASARGVVQVEDLTPPLVRQCVAHLMNPPENDRSWNFKGGEAAAAHLVWAVRGMSRCLRRDGISMHDMLVVKAPRVPDRIQPRISADEFRALERAASRLPASDCPDGPSTFRAIRDLALLYFMADTGLRASEICHLAIADVDLEAGTILVRRGKRKKDRELSLVDAVAIEADGGLTLRTLRMYVAWRTSLPRARVQDDKALWISATRGMRLKTQELRRYIIGQMCQAAGLVGSRPPHAFRRATFTEAYHSDPNALPVLAARMGWSAGADSNMAAVYSRGAEVDLARTQPRPSMAQRWRRSGNQQQAS